MARSKKAQAAIDDALALDTAEEQVGLGVDIVEIERMRRILDRTPTFARRVFSEEERIYCESHADPAVHYAARFAAKEAVVKALGYGFTAGIGVRDIEVVRQSSGKPAIHLGGNAARIAQEMGVIELPISLSHTHTDAIACAIAITAGSRTAAKRREDPYARLARQFKDAKGMLDDIS